MSAPDIAHALRLMADGIDSGRTVTGTATLREAARLLDGLGGPRSLPRHDDTPHRPADPEAVARHLTVARELVRAARPAKHTGLPDIACNPPEDAA